MNCGWQTWEFKWVRTFRSSRDKFKKWDLYFHALLKKKPFSRPWQPRPSWRSWHRQVGQPQCHRQRLEDCRVQLPPCHLQENLRSQQTDAAFRHPNTNINPSTTSQAKGDTTRFAHSSKKLLKQNNLWLLKAGKNLGFLWKSNSPQGAYTFISSCL